MKYETLEFEAHDHIGWLTLNRPTRLNALSLKMVEELRHFFGGLERHLSTRVIVVRGAGQAFCAGVDLMEMAELRTSGLPEMEEHSGTVTFSDRMGAEFADIVAVMRQAPQPLIAAVRGPAVGGGLSIALACDLRLASTSARFKASQTRLGLSGGDMGSSYFLPRLVGLARASEYLYTGRAMDAETAERVGLVCRVVTEDELITLRKNSRRNYCWHHPLA